MKQLFLLIGLSVLCMYPVYAQKAKDGAKTIATTGTVVNEYTTLTTDANSGGAFLKVSNSSLNTNSRFAGPLAKGDLVMVIQMQGATIKGTVTDSTWGAITNYNNCGQYEFLEVSSVPDASTINVNCTIKNNYTASGHVQVVRIPRYSSLTINPNITLTCDPWNGTTGGIVATEVSGNTLINTGSSIDATAKGFRGGALQNAGYVWHIFRYAYLSADSGGQKGESIAGYQSDYTQYGGMYGMGAPANGGGGGNASNASGGGGGNAGDINGWTGNGNPDISNSSWIAAWNLEYNGFANSTSSGGGRGGYGTLNVIQNPLTTAPGNTAWGNVPWCYRDNIGGRGGRPLDYSNGRLFLGGGGGAGQENNANGGGGGNGGGMVYIISYGTISGGGTVSSNGQNGQDNAGGGTQGDGPGGAGSGGTIVLQSTGNISGINVNANGGTGGNQDIASFPTEAEGGGGGGGGGYIAITNGTITPQAQGGANGTTDAPVMTSFPSDGATKGGDGLPDETATPLSFSSLIVNAGPDVTICSGQSVALYGTGGDSTVTTYSWSPSTGLNNTNTTRPIASPTLTTTYTLTATNASCPGKDSVVVSVVPKFTISLLADTAICAGQSVFLNPAGSSIYSYTWKPSASLSCANCANPSASPSVASTYTVIASNQYCSDTAKSVVSISPSPTLILNDTTVCAGLATTLNPVTNGSLQWSPGTGLSCINCTNPQITALSNTTYTITATVGNCTATGTLQITVDQPAVFAGYDTSIYNGSSVNLNATGAVQFVWAPAGSLSSSTIANPVATPSITTTYSVIGFDASGCSAYSQTIIFVNDPCQIPAVPNAFSPNGDGKNDIFKMLNPYADKLIEFNIYNRWGQLVYNTSDLNQGWNGEFNGYPEPTGTYVYYIKIICQGNLISYKGNITLIR